MWFFMNRQFQSERQAAMFTRDSVFSCFIKEELQVFSRICMYMNVSVIESGAFQKEVLQLMGNRLVL